MLSQSLIAASAGIALVTGAAHLHGTFFGADLKPADPGLEAQMRAVPLRISRQTTVWKVWIGFNAILSLGLMLFGLAYGYLATRQFDVLQRSWFLLGLGLCFLAGLVVLWWRYTFSLPVRVYALALGLYALGTALAAF